MDENKKLFYLEQLAGLTFDYTYLLKVDSNDKIVPEIIIGSFKNITGYSMEEIREKNFFLSIIYEEDLMTFLDYWGKIISGKTDTIITRILTKKNEIKWVKNYSKPIVDCNTQNITMILGAVQEITEQKLTEEILKESERTYRTLIESMGEGIILADNNDHIIYVNKKFTEMVNYQKRELIGKVGYNLFVDKEERKLIQNKNKLRESGISDNYETTFNSKNGERINVIVSGSPFTNEKEQVIGSIGIISDISEQKKNLYKIKKQNDELNILYRAGRLFSQKLDVTAIFNAVFDVITDVVDFSELFVARYELSEKLIRYIYMRSKVGAEPVDVSSVPAIPLAPKGYGILSDVIRKSESIILNDYQETLKRSKTMVTVAVQRKEEFERTTESVSKPLSAIIVPIVLDDEVLGVFQLYSQNKNAYSSEQLVFIEGLMQQVSLAYRNAVLFQQAQDEIKERKAAEDNLRASLEERELLLKEIYHRVKNNLQVVSSLLKMQSKKISDPVVKKYFLESKDKVTAISLIHEKLYTMRDLSKIDFSDYINSLVENLRGMHALDTDIDIEVNAQKLFMPIDIAMPCGLILNELIVNAHKHPFDNNSVNAKIEICFLMDEKSDRYILSVKDNGKGFPLDKEFNSHDSMGLKLINTLVKQIDGNVKLIRDNGTQIILEFPPSSYKARL